MVAMCMKTSTLMPETSKGGNALKCEGMILVWSWFIKPKIHSNLNEIYYHERVAGKLH